MKISELSAKEILEVEAQFDALFSAYEFFIENGIPDESMARVAKVRRGLRLADEDELEYLQRHNAAPA